MPSTPRGESANALQDQIVEVEESSFGSSDGTSKYNTNGQRNNDLQEQINEFMQMRTYLQ